jgi:3-oxoacyl-[acyl-carrier-protein] synthase III/acyl carrier protein
MNCPIGIRSLAVSFPSIIRTNEYWQEKYPELFAQVKPRTARVSRSASPTNNQLDIWSQAVAPYLLDPFRGNVERRVLAKDESSMTLEYRAAKEALEVAKLSPVEVELMIVASLVPEHIGSGNASYLAQQLELQCPAWNLESTCSSALVALQNAHALIQTGAYRIVLVVVSHIGSNSVDEEDTLSWSMGDGAGAFVVDLLKPSQGILSTKIVSTAKTHNAYLHELVTDRQGKPWIRTRTGENASMLAETAVDFVRECCQNAVNAAGVTLNEINFFAFNTPTAWYADVCIQALGINPERTINLYPRYANIGPVFSIANLYHAVLDGKIRENDLVLVYTKGAAATAAATVMCWGEVTIGQAPAPPLNITQDKEKIQQAQTDSLPAEKLFAAQTVNFSKEKLLATYPEERQQMLETHILEWLASLLQLPSVQLSKDQPLASILDSLTVLVLKSKIEADLQIRIPIEKFFGEKNITHLVELLLNQLVLANLANTTDINKEQEREKLSL